MASTQQNMSRSQGAAAGAAASLDALRTALLPPPRLPLSWRGASPLVLFLLIFLLTCFLLDRFDVLIFSRLWPFWLLLIAPWLWWIHLAGYAGLSRGRALAALIARFSLLGLFIILLTEPRAVRKDDGLSVVFVVDTSASVREEARDEAIKYVLQLVQEKPQDDTAGLIFFGRTAAVEHAPGPTLPFEAINVQVDHDGTDLSKALSLAAAMLPKDKNGRIVLISDGVETEGSVSGVLDDLKAKGVPVDVRSVVYQYDEEVWLERLELPPFVKIGETYKAIVILSSLKSGKGKLVLAENGQIIFNEQVEYQEGKNRFEIPIYLREPGYYEYVANIEVPSDVDGAGKIVKVRDSKKENNKAISHLYLRGKGKVLLVTDPTGEPKDYERMLQALKNAQRDTDVQSSLQFPRDPLGLLPYDCIIFANVPASAFDVQQLEAVHEAVHAQGSGFLMVGGVNSYGPGGYHRTAVETALPVSMDLSQKKILPKGALAIILHTCEFPQGNTWAKNITKQAIKVLNAQDEVGALAMDYNGKDYWIFDLTPAGDFEAIAQKLNNAQLGDMRSFANTMQMGLNSLLKSDASAKHMIIISDGDAAPPSPQMLQQFINANISVSTVAVFPHQGTGGPEVQLLSSIAKQTGGRFYFPQNPNQLPSIFIKEATTLRRSAIQEKDFVPTVQVTSSILEGIDKVPLLRGYVLTTAKEKSLTILDGPEEEELDPVLSTWRYGIGATAAWTSDLSPKWAGNWVTWDKYDAFVKQLVTSVSRISEDGSLRMRSFFSGGEGVVVVEDYGQQDSFLEMQAQLDGPRGVNKTLPLKQIGPKRYEATFPLAGEGRYKVSVVGVGANRKPERVHGGFVVPYSQEYLRFRSNPIVLQQIAQRTGGRELTGLEKGEQLFTQARVSKAASAPIVDWLLILLACLIPLDVGLRRVQIDMETIKGWLFLGRKEQPSEETFTKLLKKKEQVSGTLKEKPREEASSNESAKIALDLKINEPGPAAPPPSPRGGASPANQAQKSEAQSVTERLLAAKKRAQDQQKKDDS